jgi:ribose/xylose/arabinose/galactoside ABC-type transport system permease subunit
MERKRLFSHVPRWLLTTAVIIGGVIGLALGQGLHWTEVQSFVYTLIIASACVLIVVLLYGAVRGDKKKQGGT